MKLHTKIETKNPIEYLYSWKSPERLWKEKDKSWYVVYSFFFTVVIALLAMMGEWVLIVAILGFAFLWFVQGSVAPLIIEHTISTIGIKTYNKLYKWHEIKCFWFSYKNEGLILNLDLYSENNPDAVFKRRISLIIDEKDMHHLFDLLFDYIEYGAVEEVGVNILTELIYGKYIDIEEFMAKPLEEELDKVIEEKKEKPSHK